MGFRTTIISETKYIAWPDWFVKQYDGVLTVGGRGLSSLVECKVDFLVDEVFTDIQECLSAEQSLLVLMLHECGGVTRCTIEKEKITYIEPSEYVEVNEPTHPVYECHGCTKHLTPPARWLPIESAPKDGRRILIKEYSTVFVAGWGYVVDDICGWVIVNDCYIEHSDNLLWMEHPKENK